MPRGALARPDLSLYTEQLFRRRPRARHRAFRVPGESLGAPRVHGEAVGGLPGCGCDACLADEDEDDGGDADGVEEAFAYHDRVLREIATLAAEQGARVAFAGDAALLMNGLNRFMTTRSVAIFSRPSLQRPPPGVVVHDVVRDFGHASEFRLYWRAFAKSAIVPGLHLPIVRREHLAALAMVERDWEAFDAILRLMVPFRRRTVRRVILRDLGPRAARTFDDAAAWSERGKRPSEVRQ